jgi:hypothetical protein
VALLVPAVRKEGEAVWFFGWFSRRAALAEAYATLGRAADAARESDQYLTEVRERRSRSGTVATFDLCHALHNAAFVDVQSSRREIAVARLAEALRMPCGHRVSRALLRADPTWAPLRGLPAFEELARGSDRIPSSAGQR